MLLFPWNETEFRTILRLCARLRFGEQCDPSLFQGFVVERLLAEHIELSNKVAVLSPCQARELLQAINERQAMFDRLTNQDWQERPASVVAIGRSYSEWSYHKP